MRIAPLLVIAIAAGDARAGNFVEDWVGTWSGPATWKDCSVQGADTLDVAITWRDGTLWLDGAALYDGLGEIAPDVHDDGSLGYDDDDLAISVKRTKKKGVVLTLTTAAQCTMTAKIARATTGIGACDGLVALAAAATSCQVALDDDPTADVETWRGLTGAKRRAAATQCTARATTLKATLVADDCVPPDHDPAGSAQCRAAWQQVSRIDRCEQVPADFKASTHVHAAHLRKQIRTLSVDEAAPYCDETAQLWRETADALHCN